MRIRGFRRRDDRRPEPPRRAEPDPGPAAAEPAAAPGPSSPSTSARPPTRRRRDRRARGLRGPLAPAGSPLARTRADRFADLVLDAVERLERRWAQELADVEFAVETVPPVDRPMEPAGEAVPLSRLYPGSAGRNPRIVLYRRPIEVRSLGRADLAALVHDLIVEQVADLLGVEPETVDPEYGLG